MVAYAQTEPHIEVHKFHTWAVIAVAAAALLLQSFFPGLFPAPMSSGFAAAGNALFRDSASEILLPVYCWAWLSVLLQDSLRRIAHRALRHRENIVGLSGVIIWFAD